MIDQAQSLRELMSQRKQKGLHYVAITGGAKGVGKTTLAFNLAYFLQQAGRRPLVIQLLERKDLPENTGLIQALRNKKELSDLVLSGAGGVRYLPQSDLLGLAGLDAALARNSLLQLDTLADLIIFDATGDNENISRLVAASHETFLLITAQKEALLGTYALLKNLSGLGRKTSLFLLLNKAASSQKADLVLESFVKTTAKYTELQIRQSAFIHQDAALTGEPAKPLALSRPDSMAAQDMAALAEKLAAILAAGLPQREPGVFLNDFLKEA